MLPKPPPSEWWVFFPITGLRLQNSIDTLSSPLFGDVTLVTSEQLVAAMVNRSRNDSSSEIGSSQERWNHLHRTPTYLAVRRRVALNTKWFSEQRSNQTYVKEVQERARQTSAIITIICLATSSEGHLCGLASRFLDSQEQMVFLEIDHGEQRFSLESSYSLTDTFDCRASDGLALNWEQFGALLRDANVESLVSILTKRQPRLSKALFHSIEQACTRLAEAILAPSYTLQLLGAITSIELLLTNERQSTGFSTIENRLSALIGSQVLKRYEFGESLKSRHAFVHRSIELDHRRRPLQAIAIAIRALLIYARVASEFRHKDHLLAYLDKRFSSEELERYEESEQPKSQTDRQVDSANSVELPLFEYVDYTIEFDNEYALGCFYRFDRVFEDSESE